MITPESGSVSRENRPASGCPARAHPLTNLCVVVYVWYLNVALVFKLFGCCVGCCRKCVSPSARPGGSPGMLARLEKRFKDKATQAGQRRKSHPRG